jgi:peroxiredoxin
MAARCSVNTDPFAVLPRKLMMYAGAIAGVAMTAIVCGAILQPRRTNPPGPTTSTAALRPGGHRSGKAHFDLLALYLAADRRGRDQSALLRAVADPASELRVQSQEHPLRDWPAPLFTLSDQDGGAWSLTERLQRGPVVLVFYLNYGCDACVSRLFELNADIGLFQVLGAEIVAISNDPPELTQRRSQRYGAFVFPILSDPGHEVARAYGLYRPADVDEPERLLHGTFVIGDAGRVTWVQTGETPFAPDTATLCELSRLAGERHVRGDEHTAMMERGVP